MAESRELGEREGAGGRRRPARRRDPRRCCSPRPTCRATTLPTAPARRTTWCCASRATTPRPTASTSGCRTGRSATELGIFDYERATKISGSMFTMYRGWGARLLRASCSSASTATPTPTRRSGRRRWCSPRRWCRPATCRSSPTRPTTSSATTCGPSPRPRCRSRRCTATRSSTLPTCRCGTSPTRRASGARRARPARTPGACCGSTSSTRSSCWRWRPTPSRPSPARRTCSPAARRCSRPRAGLPHPRPVHRRPRQLGRPHLGHRGLRPRRRPVARGVVGVVVLRLPGPPGQHPLPAGGRPRRGGKPKGTEVAHTVNGSAMGWPRTSRRLPRDPPPARRQRGDRRRPAPLPGRRRGDQRARGLAQPAAGRRSGAAARGRVLRRRSKPWADRSLSARASSVDRHLDDPARRARVVVGRIDVVEVERRRTVPQVDVADDAELLEPVERAVDGGRWASASPPRLGHPGHDVVGGDVVIAGHQRLDDRPPRRRDAVALRLRSARISSAERGLPFTSTTVVGSPRPPPPRGLDEGRRHRHATRWAWMALNFGKHAGIVGVIGLAITLVLGLGITKLDFATGQDSYLNKDEQVYKDSVAYQDLFGGQAMVTLFTMDDGPDGHRPVHAREHRPPPAGRGGAAPDRGRVRRHQPAHRPGVHPEPGVQPDRRPSPRASPGRPCSAPASASPTRPRRRSASSSTDDAQPHQRGPGRAHLREPRVDRVPAVRQPGRDPQVAAPVLPRRGPRPDDHPAHGNESLEVEGTAPSGSRPSPRPSRSTKRRPRRPAPRRCSRTSTTTCGAGCSPSAPSRSGSWS